MVIDFHTHIFKNSKNEKSSIYFEDKNFRFIHDKNNLKILDHNSLLSAIEENKIDHAVAMGFPWFNKNICMEENEYLLKVMEISKNKILPFASIPFSAKNVEVLVKEIYQMNFFGIGEIAFYSEGMNVESEIYLRKILEAVQVYPMPVCIHVNEPVGHNYRGKYLPVLNNLYSILTDFPDTTIILSHWGGGLIFYELMPEVKKSFTSIYYDTAASPFLYDNDIYNITLQITGSEKILFGSDYPLIKFSRYIEIINKIIPKKDDLENILGLNAKRILGI